MTFATGQLLPEDNLVIYFAGHGFMSPMTGKGYWVPHEADAKPADLISNSDIKDFIEVYPSKHILLIADSCFSGTFITRTRGRNAGQIYESLDERSSRWVLTSGNEESVSDGKEGLGSPFARNLKRFLAENTNKYALVAELVKYVCAMTSAASGQSPQGAPITGVGHDDGQLVFVLKAESVQTTIDHSDGNPATTVLRDELRAVYRAKSNYSGGKEIALLDMTGDPKVLVIAENFRFDDEGHKKLLFKDGAVEMGGADDKNDFPVFARAATMEGMHRYLEEHQAKYEGIKIILWPAHESIAEVESTPTAIAQRELIQDMIDENQDFMRCLHCGKVISSNDGYTIEIDEIGLRPAAGNVHRECLRPVDRMIGRAVRPEVEPCQLINFDFLKWVELLKTGQGFITGALKSAANHSGAVISWNKSHQYNTGEYCINMLLEDGSSAYLKIGKDIHRFSAAEIDGEAAQMNKEPGIMGMLSVTGTFGNVDYLDSIKITGETVIPIVEYVKVRFSNQLLTKENNLDNDYAPLGLLQDKDGKIILFGNIVPLVTDPFKFDQLHENWAACGFVDGPSTLQIIETHKEVDFYLMSFYGDDLIPVLNPEFAPDKTLVSGMSILDMKDIIAHKHLFQTPGKEN